MSAAEGVPAWAVPVLEELRGFADAAWRGLASQDRVTAAWAGAMRDAITAALASDAGTPEPPPRGLRAMTEEEMAACEAVAAPEGEPFFHKLGCPKISGRGTAAHCTCPREMRAMTDEEMSASQTAAPLDESGAAAPDAELDGLILAHASTVHQHPQDSFALGKTHQAIRAHVEKVKREAREEGRREGREIQLKRAEECPVCRGSGRNLLARGLPCSACHGTGARTGTGVAEVEQCNRTVRVMSDAELSATTGMAPAPAPGDASGETDPFRYSENRRIDSNPLTMQCSKLCQLIEEFPASPQQTACIEEANRLLNGLLNQHVETQQLRAATGEVVATGTVMGRSWEGGPVPRSATVSLTVGDASRLPLGAAVSLVLRRGKEGV